MTVFYMLFHLHFNSMFYIAHPNIYHFLEVLKNVKMLRYNEKNAEIILFCKINILC